MSDPLVDRYIEALPAWQQAICQQVRALVHAADPDVEETLKRTVQPYFVLEGDAVNEEALVEMFRAIIANNRAGGWRRIKGR